MTSVEVKFGNQIPPSLSFPAACVCEGGNAFLFYHSILSSLPPDTSIDLAAGAVGFRLSPRGSGERRGNEQVQKFIKMKNSRHCISCEEEEVLACVFLSFSLALSVHVCVFGSVIWVASHLLAHSYWASFIGSAPQTHQFHKQSPAGRKHRVTLFFFFCCCCCDRLKKKSEVI